MGPVGTQGSEAVRGVHVLCEQRAHTQLTPAPRGYAAGAHTCGVRRSGCAVASSLQNSKKLRWEVMLGNGCRCRVYHFCRAVASSVAITVPREPLWRLAGPVARSRVCLCCGGVLIIQANCACVAILDTAVLAGLCEAAGSVCAAALPCFVFLWSV